MEGLLLDMEKVQTLNERSETFLQNERSTFTNLEEVSRSFLTPLSVISSPLR